ncbi:MAG: AAA family ATPase [Verrucomicrobia bacterium]|nr:AAA family ATPase [Verrucomicrobiota bacterium]MBS0637392.1 AAA family ATPase [Verrucomicrobiota bacterium]
MLPISTNYIEPVYTHYYNKLGSTFVPYFDLTREVKSLQQRVSANPAYTLSDSDLAKLEEAFTKCHTYFAHNVRELVVHFPDDQIKKAIFNALEHADEKTIKGALESFLKSLDEAKLVSFASINSEKLDEHLKKNSLLRDRALESVLSTKGKAIWKEIFYKVSYFAHHLIKTLIEFTGFSEVGGRKHGRYHYGSGISEAESKIELYKAILAYPAVVFAGIYTAVGSTAVAAIATAAVLVATTLFIPFYLRYLQPCPHQYEGLSNLNQKILRNDYNPVFHRTDILDRIQNAFSSGKGVILTADRGVGKSSIKTALAELIVAKKAKNAAGFLNNAQMFYCEASQFKDMGMERLNFTSIADTFEDHTKEFVLFIDEVASLFEADPTRGKLDKPFITFCDTFPNVICATTTKEYDEYIKDDEPANRRLVRIEVQPLTPKEVESALYQQLHHAAPELLLEDNVIPYIMEKAPEFNSKTSQIDGAMSLLKSAIAKASHITFDELEKSVNTLSLEKTFLENRLMHNQSSLAELEEYEEKCLALKYAEATLQVRQKTLATIRKIEVLSLELKKEGHALATEQTKKAWLVNYAAQQILTRFIVQKRGELRLPTGINKTLVNEILQGS